MLYPRRDVLESMSNSMINLLDKYSNELVVLQMAIITIVFAVLLYVYFYNKKKYHNLKHQIPASVVKNYLDSIIHNSTALKSSLFRGGGLDVDPSSIPSVVPLDQLAGSTPVGVSAGGDAALQAEVARLKAELSAKDNIVKDLEAKNTELEGTLKNKQERIDELEKLLADAQASTGAGGDDEALQAQLTEVTAERDRLKEDLAQYDIIEDDLADLKRLKQENEQLKNSLGGDAPAAPAAPEPVAEPVPVAEPEAAAEEPAAPVEEPEAPAEPEAAASEEEEQGEEDKSPEDLLSEFEKMLG